MRSNIRFVLIGLIILVLLILVGVLAYQIFFSNNEEVTGVVTPTAVPVTATTEIPAGASPESVLNTPTPTRVVAEETATSEATEETTAGPTPAPATSTPAAPPTATPASGGLAGTTVTTTTRVVQRSQVEQILKNGDFEEGFDDGLAENWGAFKNEAMIAVFSPESAGPYVKSGSSAQRITISQSSQGDRHAGIYQRVEVVSGQTYTLTLNGMIRSGQGDVRVSSYGYRMQYAVDPQGGTNWLSVPPENWVELPWDEQLLHTPNVQFSTYTTTLTAATDSLTLFIRTWNKWPDPGEVQYTLDSLSLVGPTQATEEVLTSTGTGTDSTLVDKPLPTTGAGDSADLWNDGRFWGALLVLLLLGAGAFYRARWSW